MKKIIFISLLAILFVSCGTLRSPMKKLKIGMTKAEVQYIVGYPDRMLEARYIDNEYLEVLQYTFDNDVYALEFWNDYLTGSEFLYAENNYFYVPPTYPPVYPPIGSPIYINRPPYYDHPPHDNKPNPPVESNDGRQGRPGGGTATPGTRPESSGGTNTSRPNNTNSGSSGSSRPTNDRTSSSNSRENVSGGGSGRSSNTGSTNRGSSGSSTRQGGSTRQGSTGGRR